MLEKPTETSFYVMAIDPGVNHLGLSVSLIDYATKTIINTYSNTIHVKEKNLNKDCISLFGLRQVKIDYLNDIITNYLDHYKPVSLILESPFYNVFRPAAFLPLIELLYQIRLTLRSILPSSNFVKYEPSVIKKTIGASAICKKEEVKKYITILKDFFKLIDVDFDTLDEHAIDSLAILYTHYTLVISKI